MLLTETSQIKNLLLRFTYTGSRPQEEELGTQQEVLEAEIDREWLSKTLMRNRSGRSYIVEYVSYKKDRA